MIEVEVSNSNARGIAFGEMRLRCIRRLIARDASVRITEESDDAAVTKRSCADNGVPTIDSGGREAFEKCPVIASCGSLRVTDKS